MAKQRFKKSIYDLVDGPKDGRRDRRRCIYYNAGLCRNSTNCIGSSHCDYYSEKSTHASTKVPPKTPRIPKHKPVLYFDGIKDIQVSDILANEKKFHKPSEEKICETKSYYDKYGELDKAIVVSIKDDKYVLEDKYLRYYVAKQIGLTKIPACIGSKKENYQKNIPYKVGDEVRHLYIGQGKIINISAKYFTIHFSSNKTVKLGITECINHNLLKLL